MSQVCILDYSISGVFLWDLPKDDMTSSEIENYIDSLGFRLSDISWMAADENIELYDERKQNY